jgi:hypothetical protein
LKVGAVPSAPTEPLAESKLKTSSLDELKVNLGIFSVSIGRVRPRRSRGAARAGANPRRRRPRILSTRRATAGACHRNNPGGPLRGQRQGMLVFLHQSPSGVPASPSGRGVWFVAWRLLSVVFVLFCPCVVHG